MRERALIDIVVEPQQAAARRAAAGAAEGLQEIEQQISISFEGTTSQEGSVWASFTVVFDVEFVPAAGQRYSDLERPLFTCGVVCSSDVGIFVQVASFTVDDRDVISGAVVKVGAVASEGVEFSGTADLSFQGYGAISDAEDLD